MLSGAKNSVPRTGEEESTGEAKTATFKKKSELGGGSKRSCGPEPRISVNAPSREESTGEGSMVT